MIISRLCGGVRTGIIALNNKRRRALSGAEITMDKRVLVINPGSTSTKLALFCGTEKVFDKTLRHSREDLQPFAWVMEQADFRQRAIEQALAEQQVDLNGLDAVCARGGQLPYCAAGTYQVDQDMVDFMYTVPVCRSCPG